MQLYFFHQRSLSPKGSRLLLAPQYDKKNTSMEVLVVVCFDSRNFDFFSNYQKHLPPVDT